MNKIKVNIKRNMVLLKIDIKALSRKTNINFLKLCFLLIFPFSRIKLTQFISISKALKMSMSNLL